MALERYRDTSGRTAEAIHRKKVTYDELKNQVAKLSSELRNSRIARENEEFRLNDTIEKLQEKVDTYENEQKQYFCEYEELLKKFVPPDELKKAMKKFNPEGLTYFELIDSQEL